MKKKFLVSALVCAMILSLCACGSDTKSADTDKAASNLIEKLDGDSKDTKAESTVETKEESKEETKEESTVATSEKSEEPAKAESKPAASGVSFLQYLTAHLLQLKIMAMFFLMTVM